MMLALALAVTSFLIVARWTLVTFRTRNVFLNPLLIPIVSWAFAYPGRALIVAVAPDTVTTPATTGIPALEWYVLATLYAVVFVLLIGVAARAAFGTQCLEPIGSAGHGALRIRRGEARAIHVGFLVYVCAYVYSISQGQLGGLYEDFSQLQKSVGEAILGEVLNLRWFVLACCLVAYWSTRQKVFMAEALLVLSGVLVTGLLTTSKGQIAYIGLLIMMFAAVIGKPLPLRYVIAVSVVGFVFAVYSYEFRSQLYYEIRGMASPMETAKSMWTVVADKPIAEVVEGHTISVLDRITHYGDAVALMSKGEFRKSDDKYALGSLVELGNLVPRIIWEGRPHLSFNHYVTEAIWGLDALSETPIGRLGEAFYVLGGAGVLYGVLYGLMFGVIGTLWRLVRGTVVGVATWIAVLMAWVVPDAYVTYGLKQIIVVMIVGAMFSVFSRQTMEVGKGVVAGAGVGVPK